MKRVICKDPHQHNLDILNQPHICSLCGGDNFLNATSVAEFKHPAPSDWVEECIKAIKEAMSLRSDIIWKESFNKAIRTALQSVTLPHTHDKIADEMKWDTATEENLKEPLTKLENTKQVDLDEVIVLHKADPTTSEYQDKKKKIDAVGASPEVTLAIKLMMVLWDDIELKDHVMWSFTYDNKEYSLILKQNTLNDLKP
jgi:hypothetical protein